MGQAHPYPSRGRAYFTTAMLSLAYALSYVDRQLPNLLIQPIKADLGLSDTQVSLLSGLSFAIFYAIAAIPLARLADGWSRRGVIVGGLSLWGVATTLCGLAGSFGSFFAARMGVGLGEAGLTPAAYSLIADLFPPGKRARATGLFVLSSAVGSGLAMLVGAIGLQLVDELRQSTGGWLAHYASWRVVLAGTGVATLALVVPMLAIADPRGAPHAGGTIRLMAVVAEMWCERKAYAPLMLAIPLINVVAYGSVAWMPTFFIRTHGWSVQQAGLWVGGASIAGGVIGGSLGGWTVDVLGRRRPAAALVYCVGALAVCFVSSVVISAFPYVAVQLGLVMAQSAMMLAVGIIGAVSIQDVARPAMRAQVSSIYLMIAALVGVGLGPTAVALLTDYVFKDEAKVGWSIAVEWLVILMIVAPIVLRSRNAFSELALQRRLETTSAAGGMA